MKSVQHAHLILAILFLTVNANGFAHCRQVSQPDPSSIEGRWDITFDMNGTPRPGWLEVRHSGNDALVGHIVVIVGSVRPISEVHFTDGKMHFSIPRQWERGDHNLDFEATIADDQLTGKMIFADGKQYAWTGVRAPALRGSKSPEWGAPIQLFNGKDLSGWHPSTAVNATDPHQWQVVNGFLTTPGSGPNLITDGTFDDFKLHVVFRYPKGSNSGVYLRGRYEVQIADNKGEEPLSIYFGGIYGFVAPSEMVAKDPGEWQSFDITLVGRMLTIVANGVTIICNQEIPGITGGALDSHEGEPGPIYFQGDHGQVEFRSVVLTPARR